MANLLSRVRGKPFFLLILMTLFISSCNDSDDDVVAETPVANNAPTISSADADTASIGTLFTYTLTASDADGDAIVLQASLLPTWLSFDAASGQLSGTPTAVDVDVYDVTLGATDGTDSTPLFLTISIVNSAPTITSTANTNAVVGSAFSYTLTANDVDADTLVMSPVALPSWAVFDAASGILTGTPDSLGDFEIELSVSDGELLVNQKFTLVVTNFPAVVIGFDEAVVFSDFGGAIADVVTNPDQSGINTSDQVGRMQKFAGELFGGTTISLDDPISLAAKLLFGQVMSSPTFSGKSIAANNVFSLKVWSQRQVELTFKLEGDVDANDVERVVTHDGTGWEVLSFDFTDVTGTGYTAITLIFDNGVMGDAADDAESWTFYFDDMVIPVVADASSVDSGTAIDFEGAVDSYAFGDFGGGQVTILANPDPSGINTSAQVAEMKKNVQDLFGGTTYTLDSPIDIPDGSVFTLKVWSQRVVAVLFKLEGMDVERIINHTGNGWEELTFDFTGDVGTDVPAVTLIFDNGTMGDGGVDWTFYFDDMTLPAVADTGNTGGGNAGTAIDFEGAVDSYAFGDFGGGQVTILANPDPSGINTSAQVAEMKKNVQDLFGGTTYTLDSPIDIPDGSVFTLKVWSQRVVAVLFKLEGMDVERIIDHTGNGWEELTFDFTGDVGTGVPAVTLIFDNGTMGDGGVNWTFYFDDMTLPAVADGGNTGGGNTGSAIDFEGAVDSYAFGDFGGGQVTILANPDPSGINTSAQVAEMKKNVQDLFGGTTYTLDSPIDIPDGSVFTLKVWSQRVVAVLFKLEGMDVERIINHGGNGWEELTFDFTGDVGTGVPAVTLIFDNGTMGDGGVNWTFYFDDMTLPVVAGDGTGGGTGGGGTGGGGTGGGGTGGIDIGAATIGIATGELTSNGDIENSNLDGWTSVTNGGVITVDDTQSSGSAYVAKMVTGNGNPSLALVGLAAGTVMPGDTVNMSFDMCGELVGDSGQVRPSLLSEKGNDAGATLETLATFNPPDMPAVWTRYNYIATAGENVTGGVTFQFDAVCGAVAGCGGDIYIDNVSLTIDGSVNTGTASGLSCVAGGADVGGTVVSSYDFEGAVDSYAFGDFGGGQVTILANPDPSGINTSAQVAEMKKNVQDLFGGTTFTLDSTIDIPDGSVFTLKVWSPRVVAVLFKLEGMNVERIVNHGGNGWEELTFDFTGDVGTGVPAVTLIFDNGTMGDGGVDWTFYFDDMTLPAVADAGNTGTAIDFEGAVDSYAFGDFGGGQVTVLANPDPVGINTSAQVAEMKKNVQDLFGGTTFTLDSTIDIPDGSVFTLKVWSPRVVAVLFKLEGMNVERIVNHGGNGWEELTFDFTGDVGTGVPAVTLIFDNGTMGDGGVDWTFYFDDMTLPVVSTNTGGGSGSGLSAIDFEAGGAGAAFTWSVFENSDNPVLEIIANPDMGGANTSATVAKFTARADGQAYAGVESAHGDFGPLTLDATNSTVKIMVWKSVISDVGIKFAIADGGARPEIKVPNTLINQWEEITFDMSVNIGAAESINIDQIIIFPDFNARAAETVSYLDNITFGN